MIKIKRIYDAPDKADGCRVLVDRLWPRGLTRQAAAVEEWMKELAPSDDLRRWFDHEPERWDGFQDRYRAELDRPDGVALLGRLRELSQNGPVTLVYAAKDTERNNAVVIAGVLNS